MARRSFRVGELGVGLHAKKLLDSALRPRSIHRKFVGVDKLGEDQLRVNMYLKQRGLKRLPANVRLELGRNAFEVLSRESPNSFSHLYCHFLLQHLGFSERQRLFVEVLRTLRPGARFTIVEQTDHAIVLAGELQKAGFFVSQKKWTADDLLKLNTPNGAFNAHFVKKNLEAIGQLGEKKIDSARQKGGKDYRARLSKLAGNDSPAAKKAIDRVVENTFLMFGQYPFRVIYAKKPKR